MRRWLTPSQLGDQIAKRNPRVAKLNQKRRREYALRLVRRVERLEEVQFLKRVDKRILISWKAIESLFPPEIATLDLLDENMSMLSRENRATQTRMNVHGSRLRDHGRRLSILEEKEAARREYEAKVYAIESRNRAAE